MKIVTIENKKDEKFLRTKTKDFDFLKYDKKEVEKLVKDMRKKMKEDDGVGLSANQVGFDFKMFVAELPTKEGKPKFYAIFNPKIEKSGGKKLKEVEGCLSVPGVFGEVERFEKVEISGLDKNQREIKIKAKGLLARVFQHEIDHLNGVLFIDKAKNIQEFQDKEFSKI